jgi:hypothetical protein
VGLAPDPELVTSVTAALNGSPGSGKWWAPTSLTFFIPDSAVIYPMAVNPKGQA